MGYHSYIASEYCVEAKHINKKHPNHPIVRTSTPHKTIASVKDHIRLMLRHSKSTLVAVMIFHNGKEMCKWQNPSFGTLDQ